MPPVLPDLFILFFILFHTEYSTTHSNSNTNKSPARTHSSLRDTLVAMIQPIDLVTIPESDLASENGSQNQDPDDTATNPSTGGDNPSAQSGDTSGASRPFIVSVGEPVVSFQVFQSEGSTDPDGIQWEELREDDPDYDELLASVGLSRGDFS